MLPTSEPLRLEKKRQCIALLMTINFIDLMICVSVGRKSALSGSNQCECAGPLQTSNSQCDGTAVETISYLTPEQLFDSILSIL